MKIFSGTITKRDVKNAGSADNKTSQELERDGTFNCSSKGRWTSKKIISIAQKLLQFSIFSSKDRLGIYIKSVVAGGAADVDGRLQAGDQLLRVDGQSLIGITQERAADYLVRTGPVVTLEVAKQGAIFHGLATLLQQPSPVIQRGMLTKLYPS